MDYSLQAIIYRSRIADTFGGTVTAIQYPFPTKLAMGSDDQK